MFAVYGGMPNGLLGSTGNSLNVQGTPVRLFMLPSACIRGANRLELNTCTLCPRGGTVVLPKSALTHGSMPSGYVPVWPKTTSELTKARMSGYLRRSSATMPVFSRSPPSTMLEQTAAGVAPAPNGQV